MHPGPDVVGEQRVAGLGQQEEGPEVRWLDWDRGECVEHVEVEPLDRKRRL